MTDLVDHRVITTGVSRHPARSVDRQAGLAPISFPLSAVLLETTSGYWLLDTGVSSHMDRLRSGLWSRTYHLVVPFSCDDAGSAAQQIDRLGIGRENISRVVVSHFHADHIGGLRDFPNAEIVGSRSGLNQIRSIGGFNSARRALFDTLLPDDIEDRFVDLATFPPVELDWPGWRSTPAWRLSSDDSIVAVDLPGHATGQIGLLLGGPEGVFHVADAAWTTRTIVDNERPSRLTRIVHQDWHAYLGTIDRLHGLVGGPELVPCHCSGPGAGVCR